MLLEFKALILKTEHKQTLQSVAVLDCIERILIGREDIIAFRLKTGSALIAVGKELHLAVHFKQGNIAIWHETLMEQ